MNVWIRPWRNLFNDSGRATRTEYLLFHVTGVAVILGAGLLIELLVGPGRDPRIGSGPVGIALNCAWAIFYSLFLVGHLSTGVRRLHDHGEPGFKYLLTFIPLIGIIFWLAMIVTRGADYENDYGPDPRNPDAASSGELGNALS